MHPHLLARLKFRSNAFSTSFAVEPRSPPPKSQLTNLPELILTVVT